MQMSYTVAKLKAKGTNNDPHVYWTLAHRGEAPRGDVAVVLWADGPAETQEFALVPQGDAFEIVVAARSYLGVTSNKRGELVARRSTSPDKNPLFTMTAQGTLRTGDSTVWVAGGAAGPGTPLRLGPVDASGGHEVRFTLEYLRKVEGSLRRRIPVVIPAVDEGALRASMSLDTWNELNANIALEESEFRATGKLASPRRSIKAQEEGGSPPQQQQQRHITDVAVTPNNKRRDWLHLCRLFATFSDAGDADPHRFPGIAALHSAVSALLGAPVYWASPSSLQRRIEERQRETDQRLRQRTEHARALRAAQLQDRVVHSTPASSILDAADAIRDQSMLKDVDRRLELEDARRHEAERRAVEELAKAKQRQQEKREQRRLEREQRLRDIRLAEEDTIDTLEAARKVRSKFDIAKQKAQESGDVSVLDNY